MIKTVVFDLDNTLYAYAPAHEAGFRAVTAYGEAVLGITPERFALLHQKAERLLRRSAGKEAAAIHSRLIRYQLLLEGLKLPIYHAPQMAACYWESFFAAVVPEPGTREALEKLREMGLRIGVGTNMTAEQQYEKLWRLGLLELVDFLVTSEEVGAEKPDGRLFRRCAEKAHCSAEDCLFVGDDLERDIGGALAAGMGAVYLRREEGVISLPPFIPQIHRIAELPGQMSLGIRQGAVLKPPFEGGNEEDADADLAAFLLTDL